MPNNKTRFFILFLFTSLYISCADYPNWKKRQWVIDKKGYNTQDTIIVKDFILHIRENDTLKVYENKLIFEDSIFNIVKTSLQKTRLNFKFIDNPRNRIKSLFLWNSKLKLKDEEINILNILNSFPETGLKLIPIIEIVYKLDGFFTTQLIMTVCIYNTENKLIYRKSRQRRLSYDTRDGKKEWKNIDYLIRTAIPIPYWERLINEVLQNFQSN